ncbi:helix-turn-helix domain-containing protein [Tsukamurella tyrosinosolvens]|nr:helix-turn-helix domain-containing protein [Tsukamurella tyrosinosolvens]
MAEILAARRVSLGLTQQTLADLAGASRSSVQSLEYGRTSVSHAAFLRVLDALGLDVTISPKGDG